MRRFMHLVLICLPMLSGLTVAVPASARKVTSVSRKCITSGTTNTMHKIMPTSANDTIEVPTNWNGTLLIYSHGFIGSGPLLNPGPDAPDGATAGKLLAEGYALSGSSFRANGWVARQAVQDQIDLLNYFNTTCGKPKRTIAWGESMGGLTTAALAQMYPRRFSGAMPMCGILTITQGKLKIPVLTMHTIGDSVVQIENTYAQVVKKAGSAAMLRQVFVDHGGHCEFTAGNNLTAMHILIDCLNKGGKWGKAEEKQVNYSQILQAALKDYLGVKERI
jgi:dienelactone hydrolase